VTKKILIGIGVAVVLGAVLFFSLRGEKRKKGVRVYAEAAERQAIARIVKESGRIDPRVKVNISAHVIGKIERLFVEEGDAIEAGSPFLELEKEAFVAARDRSRAEVAITLSRTRQAEVDLADAGVKLKRMQRLTQEQIASPEQLEAAELSRRSAELRLEQATEAVRQARAGLEKAQDDLTKTTIYAPLSGRVIALSAEEGEVVVSGTMNNPASIIGVIADLSEILAEIDVDETEVAYLEIGQKATLTVDALAERVYTGELVEIGSSGFNRPQQPDVTFFKVKVLLDQPDADLKAGMSVRAEIITAEHEGALVVPIQAVVERLPRDEEGEELEDEDEVRIAFVIGEDDTVRQQPVEAGLSDTTHVEILEGLAEGDRVVTGPYRSLKELEHGDPVRVRAEDDEESEKEDD
jgi:HlyD family secretion protein